MSDVMLATPEAPAKQQSNENVRAIKPQAFIGGEFAFGTYSAVMPEGWTVEDALRPEFYVHVAKMFAKDPFSGGSDRAGSIIELRTVDHAFYARVYVRAVQERGLIVQLMGEPVYFGPKEVKSKGYKPRWNVGGQGYDIIRLSDNEIVAQASKIKTKEQAQAWINEAMKVH